MGPYVKLCLKQKLQRLRQTGNEAIQGSFPLATLEGQDDGPLARSNRGETLKDSIKAPTNVTKGTPGHPQ
jgi:hypothetical protein